MNKTKVISIVVCLAVMFIVNSAHSVILDTSNIFVYAGGSLGSIAGSGSVGLLDLPVDSTLEYFTIENTSFSATNNLGFPNANIVLSFLYKNNANVTTSAGSVYFTSAGQTITIPSPEHTDGDPYNKLRGYVSGSGVQTPIFEVSMNWRFGGIDATANANFLLTAHGTAPPPPVVPEPISSLLFITGGTTLGFRCLWKKSGL